MSAKLKFIPTTDTLYNQAKQIRIDCFFKGMSNAERLIHDEFEEVGIHLLALNKKNQVIGTGRIHMIDSTGIISQMAIKADNQRTGIGQKILNELVEKCKTLGATKIELSARETALAFYSKSGFKTIGEKFSSSKTGIIHQKMCMNVY